MEEFPNILVRFPMISVSSKLGAWKSDFYMFNDADQVNQSIG